MQDSQFSTRHLKVGTRGSPLALKQAETVGALLADAHGLTASQLEICTFTTTGDQLKDHALSDFGGKGLFTKEIDTALLEGDIDLGVHSAKDLPGILPEGLAITGYLPREDVRDAFMSINYQSLRDVPEGARIGTASLRRKAQVLALRPDLDVVHFRGNVQTRLKKLEEGQVAGTLLALAGLKRLGMQDRASEILALEDFLPALGQGAICLVTRQDDTVTSHMAQAICDQNTYIELSCERSFMQAMDGNCRMPLAGLSQVSGNQLTFKGVLMHPNGQHVFSHQNEAHIDSAQDLGRKVASVILESAESEILDEIRALSTG